MIDMVALHCKIGSNQQESSLHVLYFEAMMVNTLLIDGSNQSFYHSILLWRIRRYKLQEQISQTEKAFSFHNDLIMEFLPESIHNTSIEQN